MPAKLALFGYPVAHSVSPAMHNAALQAAGLDFTYEAVPVAPEVLPAVMGRLRAGEWAGANVTIPHKQAVIEHLDALTNTAESIGAVNTIYHDGGRLVGDNTDAGGFLDDLDGYGVRVDDRPVLLFGTGGSARAVAFGLLQRDAQVHLLGRNQAARRQLAADLHQRTGGKISAHDWTAEHLARLAPECALAVNCTPLGMHPQTAGTPWFATVPTPTSIFIYDLVYNPAETVLIQQAHSSQARAAGGLGMLVGQGALAFRRWTGIVPDRAVMQAAAQTALHLEM